jgi:hypothetical protein
MDVVLLLASVREVLHDENRFYVNDNELAVSMQVSRCMHDWKASLSSKRLKLKSDVDFLLLYLLTRGRKLVLELIPHFWYES